MPEIEKKEPGRAEVKQRERGDLRQRHQPIDKQRDETEPESAQDKPPASRGKNSPWMGGGSAPTQGVGGRTAGRLPATAAPAADSRVDGSCCQLPRLAPAFRLHFAGLFQEPA